MSNKSDINILLETIKFGEPGQLAQVKLTERCRKSLTQSQSVLIVGENTLQFKIYHCEASTEASSLATLLFLTKSINYTLSRVSANQDEKFIMYEWTKNESEHEPVEMDGYPAFP